jgi:hypothetical protein
MPFGEQQRQSQPIYVQLYKKIEEGYDTKEGFQKKRLHSRYDVCDGAGFFFSQHGNPRKS